MSEKFIPLHAPVISNKESIYVKDCLKTSWVSTAGKYVELFEEEVKKFTNSKYAIACINGTSALHISLILSGVSSGDEIIVPTMSFIAPINVIHYCNASPIFMDVNDEYCLDIKKTIEFIRNETFLKDITFNKTSKKIRALIVVHAFGRSSYFEELAKICRSRNIKIIEDAAEGVGNVYLKGGFKGKHVGTIGEFGCLSFNGNKVITAGGGGVILTQNSKLAKKAKYLTTQAKNNEVFFVHNEIGFNYRLTNLQAALGLAQLKNINKYLEIKKKIYLQYLKLFSNFKNLKFKNIPNFAASNYWLNIIEFKNKSKKKELSKFINYMKSNKIEVRPIWKLNHLQKPYLKAQNYKITNALKIVDRSICLPSSINLMNKDIKRIVSRIND